MIPTLICKILQKKWIIITHDNYIYSTPKKEMPQIGHLFSLYKLEDLVFGFVDGDYSSQTEEMSPQFLQIEWKYTWSFPSASVSS